MATVGKTTKIDSAAQRYLASQLNESTGWILRDDTPDYHLDYSAEFIEKDEPSGRRIYVQLKGTKSLKINNGNISFQMKVKHLLYYEQVTQAPVFLVVVDTENSNGYYVFLQRYLDGLESSEWKKRTKKSVVISIGKLLSSCSRFITEVGSAWEYMKERHPGSPMAAIRNKQAILEGLDDRLDYRIDVVDGKEVTRLQCKPGKEVTFKITGKPENPDLANKIMGYGEPGTINFDDVEIEGSRILNHFGKGRAKASFSPSTKPSSGATLRIVEQNQSAILAEFPVVSSLGVSGFSCQTSKSSAIQISFNSDFPDGQSASQLRFNFGIDLEKWIGHDISRLEGLPELNALCEAALSSALIRLEVWKSGVRVFKTDSVALDQNLFRDFADILRFISMSGDNFKQSCRYKQLPKLKTIYPEDWYVAELLYAINVRKELFISTFSGRKLTFKVEGINPNGVPENGKQHAFKIDMIRLPVSLLGEDLITSIVTLFVTDANSELTMESEGIATLIIVGSNNSELKLVP